MRDSRTDPLEVEKYSQGCEALRHYSQGVLRVRAIAIAQGFALLAAEGYFVLRGQPWPAAGIVLFGLLFTAVLYSLQLNYWNHFESMLDYVVEREEQFSSPARAAGPWSAYGLKRQTIFGRWWRSWLSIHGPYLLLALALVLMLVVSLFAPLAPAGEAAGAIL